jgi:hypothetical protein
LYIEQGNVVNQAAELGHNLAGSHDRKNMLVSTKPMTAAILMQVHITCILFTNAGES